MNEWFSILFDQQAVQDETRSILYIALAFFIGGLVVILILFGSRVSKTYYELRSQELNKKLQGVLNSIIVNAVASENAIPDSAFQFHLSQINLLVLNSPFRKQLVIDQLIRLKKNLTGASADILQVVYLRLSLERVSLQGLKSFRWFNKARAMRELSEMHVREAATLIARHLHSRNTALREEAFISMANLNTDAPLDFLDTYDFQITEWMQLNVYSVLQRIDSRNLPDFSRWFDHQNKSVRLFAIRMATQFKQYQSVNRFKRLLADPDPDVQFFAVKAMADLELDQFVDDVITLKDNAWNNEALAKVFVQFLGKVFRTAEIEAILREFMKHDVYAVSFDASASLLKNSSSAVIVDCDDEKSQRMIRHLSEPLLS